MRKEKNCYKILLEIYPIRVYCKQKNIEFFLLACKKKKNCPVSSL